MANVQYNNPVPVVVAVVPVYEGNEVLGLLGIFRGIPPALGEPALPGGYVDEGENAESAVLREFREETGLETKPYNWRVLKTEVTTTNRLLIFCENFKGVPLSAVASLRLNPEVQGFKVLKREDTLAFPLHTQMLREYLK